jgi:myo-inositol-1-phosphate synthase
VAKTKKQAGAIEAISAYGFKHPPKLLPIEAAEEEFKKFVA